jgi:hypothetical protein
MLDYKGARMNEVPSETAPKPKGDNGASEEKAEDIRQLLFHVNNVFHTRVNLLLVAESIFFAAIASLWQSGDTSIKLIICGLGVTMTLILWFSNSTLHRRSNFLTTKLKQVDSIYRGYLDVVPLRPISVTAMLTHFLPVASLAAWALVILIVLRVL